MTVPATCPDCGHITAAHARYPINTLSIDAPGPSTCHACQTETPQQECHWTP